MHFELKIAKASSLISSDLTSSRQFYLEFIEEKFLNKEALLSFFEEYKELTELIKKTISFFIDHINELLDRFQRDEPLLSEIFHGGKPLGELIHIKLGEGDSHNWGRSVVRLTFSSNKILYYKPKSIQIVHNFQLFLARLNEWGLKPELNSYLTLPRADYGWEEGLEPKACQTFQEVQRYFLRAGSYLCLLFLFSGRDTHYENLIASAGHPFLIDLETLFCSLLVNPARDNAEAAISESVIATGLLPILFLSKWGQKGKDISGLGQGKEAEVELAWRHLHTAHMEQVEEITAPAQTANQVYFLDRLIRVEDHIEKLKQGFIKTYSLIHSKRALIEKEGLLEVFSKDSVRMIIRPTRFYVKVLEKLQKPHALLNRDIRNEVLALMDRPFWGLPPLPPSLIAAEKESLLNGDIPYFYTTPSSCDLFAYKKLAAPNCLKKPALQTVKERLKNMGPSELRLQKRLLEQSFLAKNASVHSSESAPQSLGKVLSPLERAIGIGEQLKKSCFRAKDHSMGWIALEPNLDTEQMQLTPIQEGLYSGRVGVALFFAALNKATQDNQWKVCALNTLRPICQAAKNERAKSLLSAFGIGGMAGIGGMIYGLLHIGKLLNAPRFISDARRLIDLLKPQVIREDVKYDLVFGSAGLLLSLLSFYRSFPEAKVLTLATQCAEHLMSYSSKGSLLGLSHGAAGIAHALFEFGHLCHLEKYIEKAEEVLAYERAHFCPLRKNWPKFMREGESRYMSSWCHGATGIGLSRLFFQKPSMQEEVQIALQRTREDLFHGPMTLCCGLPGRFEFFNEAAKLFPTKEIHTSMAEALERLCTKQDQQSDLGPSLMQGSAGIGYTLLRYLDKENALPQVLLLS